jgi:uncharacterized protein YdeI (YjbR/CyaY-like superfamily)
MRMVEITEKRFFSDRGGWRAWLEKNHATEKEVWLVFYKKHTGKTCISLDEAVEEALCFGWIDSVLKRIDDKKHVLRFSPRKHRSIWSESNVKRVKKLIGQGKMTNAGLEKTGNVNSPENRALRLGPKVPRYIAESLKSNPMAKQTFENLSPSQKKQYVWWITSAKMDETRKRRVKEGIRRLSAGRKPGIEWW